MPRGRKKTGTIWDRRTEEESEYAREVAKRIQVARHEADAMTQRELADLLGVTERSVAAYENGEVVPYRFMRELEKYLDRPAGWFLHGDAAPVDDQHYQLLLDEIRKQNEEIKKLRAEVNKALQQ